MYTYIYIYTYIYMYREREIDSMQYIYIYIHMLIRLLKEDSEEVQEVAAAALQTLAETSNQAGGKGG